MRESVNEKMDIKNVLYKTRNVLLIGVDGRHKEDTAYIVCEGLSMSVDDYNVPYKWDPYLSIPTEKEYEGILNGDIISMYFPFECKGLQKAGEDLAFYINENMKKYSQVVIIGHSKAGVCIANMARMLARKCVLVFVSAPFEGTIIVDSFKMKKRLTTVENKVYQKYYNQHSVDLDIMPKSLFLRKADFSGVKNHLCINIVSECVNVHNIVDLGCKYLGHRIGYKHSDGIISVSSQERLSKDYPTVKEIRMDASHANSLKRLLSLKKEKYIIE